MKGTYRFLFFFTLPVMDFVIITCAGLLSYGLYRILGIGQNAVYPFQNVFHACLITGLVSVSILFLMGTYKKESGLLNVQEIKNTIKGITISFLIFSAAMVLLRYQIPRYVLVFSYLLSITLLVAEKTALYHILPLSKNIQGLNKRILIYGAGDLGLNLFRSIANSPKLGIFPVGFIDDNPDLKGKFFQSNGFANASMDISVLGTGQEINRLIDTQHIDEVCVAISNIDNTTLIQILDRLKSQKIRASFVPNLYEAFVHKVTIDKVGQIPIVREADDYTSKIRTITKKAMDILLSLSLLAILSPVFTMIAVFIKKESNDPVFFTHNRVGLNGTLFKIIKFRTMKTGTAPYEINPVDIDDSRITRVGRFLRKTSLDELPQLINVLRGDMSLVGPRPEMPFIVDTYTDLHRERLTVKPGITGLWQLSGDRVKPIHENMDYDLYYIKNSSFFLDVAILIETVLFAFRGV